MKYVSETWTLTSQVKNKLAAAQIQMESSMQNIVNVNTWLW